MNECDRHAGEDSFSSWTTTTVLFWSVSVAGGTLLGLIVVLGMIGVWHVKS